MTLEALIAALHELKGTGRWRELARVTGVDYTTISRIYRGERPGGMPNPGIKTVEKLVTGLQLIERRHDTRTAEKVPAPLGRRKKDRERLAQGE